MRSHSSDIGPVFRDPVADPHQNFPKTGTKCGRAYPDVRRKLGRAKPKLSRTHSDLGRNNQKLGLCTSKTGRPQPPFGRDLSNSSLVHLCTKRAQTRSKPLSVGREQPTCFLGGGQPCAKHGQMTCRTNRDKLHYTRSARLSTGRRVRRDRNSASIRRCASACCATPPA